MYWKSLWNHSETPCCSTGERTLKTLLMISVSSVFEGDTSRVSDSGGFVEFTGLRFAQGSPGPYLIYVEASVEEVQTREQL